MHKKKIVAISDRYNRYHRTDENLLSIVEDNGLFLHPEHPALTDKQFLSTFDRTHVYLRLSHFNLFSNFELLQSILTEINPAKITLGYHCHLGAPSENERRLFNIADRYVLLSHLSERYFKKHFYSEMLNKPVFYIPSLYLPPRSWFGNFYEKPAINPDCVILAGQVVAAHGRFSIVGPLSAMRSVSDQHLTRFSGLLMTDKVDDQCLNFIKSFNNLENLGLQSPEAYHNILFQRCSYGVLNGFSSCFDKSITHFDFENYPIRLSSFIKTNVIPIGISGVYQHAENICNQFGFGVFEESWSHIFQVIQNGSKKARLEKSSWEEIVSINSFDVYKDELIDFIVS